MSDLKRDFEKLSLDFSNSQYSLNELLVSRSKLETQFQENNIVMEEFDYLNEDSKIYKLTGPILMPQDYNEAKMNVKKRIEFIQNEIQRIEGKIQEEEKNMTSTRENLLTIRSKLTS